MSAESAHRYPNVLVCACFHPRLDPLGVRDAGVPAQGIQQHDDHRTAFDDGRHDQALAGLGDVAGLLHDDVPPRVRNQVVGVAEFDHVPADLHGIVAVGGVFTNAGV